MSGRGANGRTSGQGGSRGTSGRVTMSGGSARGMVLHVPVGARPTTGRVREALFSILGSRVVGATVLDCFAGAGTLGLEALSRGAAAVVAVDNNRSAVAAIRANAARLGFADQIRVVAGDLETALTRLEVTYTLVLADPPYDLDIPQVVRARWGSVLARGGVLVVERSVRRPSTAVAGLLLTDSRVYGETALDFFEHPGQSGDAV